MFSNLIQDQTLNDDDKKQINNNLQNNGAGFNQGTMPAQQAINSPQNLPADNSNGYLNSNNINPTPTGTNVPGKIVTAGMPTMQQQAAIDQANKPSGWTPPPGYLNPQIDPNKQNGIWQMGYAKGQLAAIDARNSIDENNRANELQTWRREAITKDQQIQMGMQQAAQKGGYGGVVDYLNTADPEKAIQIQQAKTDLDTSMLKADSLKTLNDEQKKEALFAGYGLLGKMGATLLQAPQNERPGLYQTMLPFVKAVNPDAPDQLNQEAGNMFLLAAGQQGMDYVKWAQGNEANQAESQLGQLQDDLQTRRKQGIPDTDPGNQALISKINEASNQAQLTKFKLQQTDLQDQQSKMNVAKTQQEMNNQFMSTQNSMVKTYQTMSKNYADWSKSMDQFQGASKRLAANPKDSSAQAALGPIISTALGMKLRNPTAWNAMVKTDSQAEDTLLKIQSLAGSNGKQEITPDIIGKLNNLMYSMGQELGKTQQNINQTYQSQINDFNSRQPSLKDIDGKPLKFTINNFPFYKVNTLSSGASSGPVPTPQELDQMAQKRIQSGEPLNDVMMRLKAAREHLGYE